MDDGEATALAPEVVVVDTTTIPDSPVGLNEQLPSLDISHHVQMQRSVFHLLCPALAFNFPFRCPLVCKEL